MQTLSSNAAVDRRCEALHMMLNAFHAMMGFLCNEGLSCVCQLLASAFVLCAVERLLRADIITVKMYILSGTCSGVFWHAGAVLEG